MVGEKMTDYEKLKEITEEIDTLIAQGVSSSDSEFQAWRTKAERILIKIYGDKSYEVKNFKNRPFSLTAYLSGTDHSAFVKKCAEDLTTTKTIFQEYLKEFLEDANVEKLSDTPEYSNVFIVHGHDGELKNEVALLLKKQNINGIILSEQANQGRTIIEKFEDNSDRCSAAIILMTADDEGKSKKEIDTKPRARQNVIFEAGYFMGKLGRANVIIIVDAGVEIPSDLQGVVCTDSGDWKLQVLGDLKQIGYTVDANLLF
jgi:predicted nucleotide-binding protein